MNNKLSASCKMWEVNAQRDKRKEQAGRRMGVLGSAAGS
jgi:hypothetical protein